MEKQCTKCKNVRLFSEFGDKMYHADTKQSQCWMCERERKIKWHNDNRQRYYENRRIRAKERYATDINFRLAKNRRSRLRKALLNQVTYKNNTTEALLGISYSEFKKYFEYLMTK